MADRKFDEDYAWANGLWHLCEANAKDLTGQQVVSILAEVSGDVYWSGYDDAFKKSFKSMSPSAVASHDVGWLTLFAVRLQQAKR